MAEMGLAEGVALLAHRAKLAKIACWTVVGAGAGMIGADVLQYAGVANMEAADPAPIDSMIAIPYLLWSVLFIISVVFVSMWIYRAHANLYAADIGGLSFTPGWSVGWFFIPFANLVQPYKAMTELEHSSDGSDGAFEQAVSSELGPWWGCWLGGNILSSIAQRLPQGDGVVILSIVSTALLMVSAWLLIRIITNITRTQRDQLEIQSAFG